MWMNMFINEEREYDTWKKYVWGESGGGAFLMRDWPKAKAYPPTAVNPIPVHRVLVNKTKKHQKKSKEGSLPMNPLMRFGIGYFSRKKRGPSLTNSPNQIYRHQNFVMLFNHQIFWQSFVLFLLKTYKQTKPGSQLLQWWSCWHGPGQGVVPCRVNQTISNLW
jgi:hypothetical protein